MLSHLFIETCVDRMSVGFGARIFACVLVCCLVLSIKSDVYRGPLNAAVFPGNRISLNCENENKSNKTKWTFYGTNSTAVSTTYHDSNYVINETKSRNAGTYGCLVSSGEYRARLVVLESDPECRFQINGNTISSSNSIELKSGDFIDMWCQIRFWGDWSPTMHWEITPRNVQFGTEVTTVKSENILKSSFKFSVPDNYSTHVKPPTTFRLSCRTNFTKFNKSKENAGAVLKVASNIPSYNYTWASPDIVIRSTGIPISESGAKQENLVIVINPQTAVILVTCLAAIIIGILLVVILKRKVRDHHCSVHHCKHVETSCSDSTSCKHSCQGSRKDEFGSIAAYAETHQCRVDHGLKRDMVTNSELNNRAENFDRRSTGSSISFVTPIYSQVNKHKVVNGAANIPDPLYSEIKENPKINQTDHAIEPVLDATPNVLRQNIFIGADGTVYAETRTGRKQSNIRRASLKMNNVCIYAPIDHTCKPPSPPPKYYLPSSKEIDY